MTKWRGQYISIKHFDNTKEFLREAFIPTLPWLYATNKQFLVEVQDYLIQYQIHSHLEEFVNCECRYVLRCDNKVFEFINS